jgi:hypothetical protein
MNEEAIETLRRIQAFASYSANVRVMMFDLDVYDAFKLIEKCIDELIEREEGKVKCLITTKAKN